MTFEEKIKKLPRAAVWQEYCGFLDFTLEEYMQTQERLLMEQIDLLSKCELGRRLFGDTPPRSLEEFRRQVPLTTFEDYADILLLQKDDALPAPAVIWLQTTWEGGSFPHKCAPYTAAMLETYKNNTLATMLLTTSKRKGHFNVKPNGRMLYALAPLPYATGLVPTLLGHEITFRFLPSVREAKGLSLSQQNELGFRMSMKSGMNLFFGMSSILYGASRNFQSLGGKAGSSGLSLRKLAGFSPVMLYRMLTARYRAKRDGTQVLPRDLYKLDGFVCIGTDSARYKDELEAMWGCRPLEVCGGTEPTCIGVETWSKNGLVFFPDACFYEFIPEQEMLHSLRDPSYTPKTYLMNELSANQNYELVITVLKGGAFTRYRVGDVYRCLRTKNPADELNLPQFEYVDRIPTVIDIAGFTRITEREIRSVIELSGLPIHDWFALKEYDEHNHSFLHLYVEMEPGSRQSATLTREILCEHLGIYFRFYDGDYKDLKKLLGINPLEVTILRTGSIQGYETLYGEPIPHINPPHENVLDLLRLYRQGPDETEAKEAAP